MLQADLNRLGGQALSGNIQCIDTVGGCILTLNRMQLVQATGFLYDCYLFGAQTQPRAGRLPCQVLARIAGSSSQSPCRHQSSVHECCGNLFNKLEHWPQFDEYLQADYMLYVQRTPPHEVRWWNQPTQPTSYRIYLRKAN